MQFNFPKTLRGITEHSNPWQVMMEVRLIWCLEFMVRMA